MITVFILGSKCNMNCKFCMSEESDLNKDFIKKKLKELKGTVVFTGGEPLLYDVNEYLSIAKDLGLKTKVQTNGKLIRELNLDLVDVVNLPVDGCKKTHDWLREKGHFKTVMRAAKFVSDKELSVTTVLTSVNLNEIEEIYDVVNSIGASSWKLFKFKPKGRGRKHRELSISEEEFSKAVKKAKNIAENLKVYAVRDPDKMNALVFRSTNNEFQNHQ